MGTREDILAIFEDTREAPGASYDTERFLEGLIVPNGKQIDDSFKGKRFKNRFLRQIERDFAICLPETSLERRWALDAFVEHVEDRQSKPKVNLNLAGKRLKQARYADVTIYAVLIALLAPPSIYLPHPWRWVPLALLALALAGLIRLKRLNMAHFRALADDIKLRSGL